MKGIHFKISSSCLFGLLLLASASAQLAPAPAPYTFKWQVVVNNGITVPGDTRKFNSYNQPSMNVNQFVVFRARSRGGMQGEPMQGEPAHGIFMRDMAGGTPLQKVFDRNTTVPQPNNLDSTFTEPPSFPRIDMWSDTVASRGNHQPVWEYLLSDGTETRAGTTGIYTNPFGNLITGTSNLGAVPEFDFFAVPDTGGEIKFDVFPGSPSVTDGATIVFKGNYTVGGAGLTGVYYRDLTNAPIPLSDGTGLVPAGGTNPVIRIADRQTQIPGTSTLFGSTAPPSAVGRKAVFAGFAPDEWNPTQGGIFLAPLTGADPPLTALVRIGGQVPGEKKGVVFNKLGEGVSFDGRFVAFWGAWDAATRKLVLQCPGEGNKVRLAYCKRQYPSGFPVTVPLNQGIFVHDIVSHTTYRVANSPANFTDFVFWNFSGRVPGMGEGGGDSDEPGEPARWRSATFVAVSGLTGGQMGSNFRVAFKARTGRVINGAYVNPVDGIYLRKASDIGNTFATVVQTGMDGTLIDPQATSDPLVTEMGLERDGFRGDSLVINVRMGTEEEGWAGIYLTQVPK